MVIKKWQQKKIKKQTKPSALSLNLLAYPFFLKKNCKICITPFCLLKQKRVHDFMVDLNFFLLINLT